MKKSLSKIIKESKIIVREGRYAYLKTKQKQPKNYFMVSKDNDEVTIVAEEEDIPQIKYQKIEKWFKLFEIKVSVPFLGVGFLAKIAKAIAGKKLNILIISTFSKDYILIRESKYKNAVKALQELGFDVKIKK